jgi:hypothetical protein
LLNSSIVAVELYLKSLSAKTVHRPVPDSNWVKVHAEPEQKGHKLNDLLRAIHREFRERLEREYRERHSTGLADALSKYEGLFSASRYPYEENRDLARYPLEPLMTISAFLRDFVTKMEPVQRLHQTCTLSRHERRPRER